MPALAQAPEPGQIVRVRQRQYLVEGTVPPSTAGDATLVRLSCLDDDAQGQEVEVLWEVERDGEILSGGAWDYLAQRWSWADCARMTRSALTAARRTRTSAASCTGRPAIVGKPRVLLGFSSGP